MRFTESYARWFKRLLPTPFTIAIILSVITLLAALVFSDRSTLQLAQEWQNGLWDSSLLTFAFQMMLMLVLGHVLALSSFFNRLTDVLIKPIDSTAQAAFIVCLSTVIVAYINWGLGLIFGAILARKMAEHFTVRALPFNYPLIGACGYIGLMVWHGGISGSSLTKVAEKGHLQEIGGSTSLPEAIYFSDTVFSTMNLTTAALILICLPAMAYFLGKRGKDEKIQVNKLAVASTEENVFIGAEKLDHKQWISKTIGAVLLLLATIEAINYNGHMFGYISPNYINFCLLGWGLLLHKNIHSFLSAVDDAIKGASGILIQFPIYFGILALMRSGGLVELTSAFFIQISNQTTLPIFTFFSAGLVNIFVPSGGGQWAIQGPILIDAATQLNVPLNKCIMAMAYGDQVTNMLQPFWALPLLSITGLKAKEILPYTLLFMLIGSLIFILGLLVFNA